MKNKLLSGILCLISALILTLEIVPFSAECSDHTVGEVDDLIGGIVSYKLGQAGAGSVEEWLESGIAEGAGRTTDWYALTLSQCGYTDLSAYERSLTEYLGSNNIASATSREKYALALCAAGSGNSYITDILDSSIGEQGMMSWIYGLHVLNNGYTCSRFTAESVVDTILSMQYPDGGWALFGDYGDIDVTAMTVQALAPYYHRNGEVSDSVDRAIDFMSRKQMDTGGYESFGNPNPESTAQVLTAVSALGIDCRSDERFIKNGSDLIDGIVRFRLPDGSFSHIEGGGSNETATVQAYYSFVAFRRMTEGKSPLLILDNRRHETAPPQNEETPTQGEAVTEGTTAPQSSSAVTASQGTTVTVTKTAAVSASASLKKTETAAKEITSAVTAVRTESIQSAAAPQREESGRKGGLKPKLIIIIAGSALVLSLIMLILGKRNIRNFIFIGIAAGAAVLIVLVTDISSADEYYSGNKKVKDNAVGTVTMEIRCDTIAGRAEHIPADGVILPPTAFDIEAGDTVFDILTEAAQTCGIQVENKGSAGGAHGMVYISGINYIYEYDFGDLSGWVYHVNGIAPSRSCGEYELSDGDRVEWLYTCEIGHDLNEVYEQ
ncbi:MAG: DUF4430 domain-containing protein [Ruminococcus sp.]|uniref:DUF4430 domain-containing protein n=1 Tax=Ruminococcus sp. TaxID=41978 RepID=UPI0025DB583B|nr:DUF4430 domain-containing protein [Ruminococcus sp.]MBR5683584.1 DUF4430 domain-containing protein [Ruminococcus sp.]